MKFCYNVAKAITNAKARGQAPGLKKVRRPKPITSLFLMPMNQPTDSSLFL